MNPPLFPGNSLFPNSNQLQGQIDQTLGILMHCPTFSTGYIVCRTQGKMKMKLLFKRLRISRQCLQSIKTGGALLTIVTGPRVTRQVHAQRSRSANTSSSFDF